MKAKDIMVTEVITVKQQATIEEIARVLVDNKISGVPVVDEADRLMGIVTEGDLLHKETNPRLPNAVNILGAIIYYNGVERYNEDFKKLMAGQALHIMTDKVITVSGDEEIEEIAKIMLERGIKRLPVVEGDHIIGIISRADIVKCLLA